MKDPCKQLVSIMCKSAWGFWPFHSRSSSKADYIHAMKRKLRTSGPLGPKRLNIVPRFVLPKAAPKAQAAAKKAPVPGKS